MKLSQARILLTGATGGIGRALAQRLAAEGASLVLSGRRTTVLEGMAGALRENGARVAIVAADLADADARGNLARVAADWQGGVNVVIHNAGINVSGLFEDLDAGDIERMIGANVSAPLLLTQELLPALRDQPAALVLFMGSGFGALGYPGFATYSATKFAIRGFAEALRRELADTAIDVALLAPRAVDTPLNDARTRALQQAMKMGVDTPECIAEAVVRMIRSPRAERHLGWPERFFTRLNRLAPGLVDGSLRHQLPEIRARLQS